MIRLDLTKEETGMLIDMLEYDYKQLRNEISNTENWEFKAGLKKKEELLKKLLAAARG
jgi:hypothetical protein